MIKQQKQKKKKKMLERGLLRAKYLSETSNIMVGWCQEMNFSFLFLIPKSSNW